MHSWILFYYFNPILASIDMKIKRYQRDCTQPQERQGELTNLEV